MNPSKHLSPPPNSSCKSGLTRKTTRVALIAGLIALGWSSARLFGEGPPNPVYEKVVSFAGLATSADVYQGSSPNDEGGLVLGSDGSFYGTTHYGGLQHTTSSVGEGTVFRINPQGDLTTLVDFTGNDAINKGAHPQGKLLRAPDGNFYGTTSRGGANDMGTIFRMTPSGSLTTLVEFTGNGASNKGAMPAAGLIRANDGSFYGTTTEGGADGFGTIFRLSVSGTLTTLVELTGDTGPCLGRHPRGELLQASDGNFYGSTSGWRRSSLPVGFGTVFRMTAAGTFTTLVEFTGNGSANKGATPLGGMMEASPGVFYGTTGRGGSSNAGTIYRMTSAGLSTTLTTLIQFTVDGPTNRGAYPASKLVRGTEGNIYGTTAGSGFTFPGVDNGTIFRLTPEGVLTTLIQFDYTQGPQLGRGPSALTLGIDGAFYGTTATGGIYNNGTAFKLTANGQLTTLLNFSSLGVNPVGSDPSGPLVQTSDGCFFGTTRAGGSFDKGTVFKVTPTGSLTTLVHFSGNGIANKGTEPAGLVRLGDGNFYGTTLSGGIDSVPGLGSSGNGTIFRMAPDGMLTTLVEFSGGGATNRGARPNSLVVGNDGNLYGTTSTGGIGFVPGDSFSGNGTVFRMTPRGELTTLAQFDFANGSNPTALIQARDGTFYGTTSRGGCGETGVVFKMTAGGAMTILGDFGTFLFTCPSALFGASPSGLLQASNGNIYVTTIGDGSDDWGTIYSMTPDGTFSHLEGFLPSESFFGPVDPRLSFDIASGAIYGTTTYGGSQGLGTIFRMTGGAGTTTILDFSFDPLEGYPSGPLIEGWDGNYYGTTSGSDGAVYRLIFPGPPIVYPIKPEVLSETAARIAVHVNARGLGTVVSLEYGTDGVRFPNSVPIASNLDGFQTTPFGTTLTGLSEGATYHYRFRALNENGTIVTPVRSFSTLAVPLAVTNAASSILPSSATLNGTVNARNHDATVAFEWGIDGNSFPNIVAAAPSLVTGNTDTMVSASLVGLTKARPYYYRVRATNAGGVAVSGTQSFTTLTEPAASVGSSFALTTTSARVNGTVRARNSDTQVTFEYGTDGVTFPNSVAAAPPMVAGDVETAVSADIPNLLQNVTYYYRVRAVSAGGETRSSSASLQMEVLSGFLQIAPSAPLEANGFLLVSIVPPGIGAGWRFVGEQLWRDPGTVVGGLTTGDREIEFRPVAGFHQPARELVSIISGDPATVFEGEYAEVDGPGGTGRMIISLKPDSIADTRLPVAHRAQWRLLGEDDSAWKDSGVESLPLRPGAYLVECKPVPGRTTPRPLALDVVEGKTEPGVTTYFLADTLAGTAPSVLPFDTVTGSPSLPYRFVGQVRADAGSGSGFVVRPRVVATAAHVVFDDGTLSAATGSQWIFQRDRMSFEAKPQTPRGFYLFTGYAAQRAAENTPGESSPDSQTLDAAALYFLEDAGRGGFGGYLASDATPNQWLASSAQKMLVGYPVDGISGGNQGRMHATPPTNVSFAHSFGRTYTTAQIRSSGGSSGGPLCVQFENGSWYPAAIYLGGTGQTVVRVIDSALIDMFDRAEVSGNGGGNNTGGGISHTSAPISGSTTGKGSIKVNITPAAVVTAARWRLSDSSTVLRTSGTTSADKTPGGYRVYFTELPGYASPASPYSLTVRANTVTTVNANYRLLQTITFPAIPDRHLDQGTVTLGATASSGLGVTYAVISGPATPSGNVLTFTGYGTVTVRASQAGNGDYAAAADVTRSFAVVARTLASWITQQFTEAEQSDPAISGPLADPDRDGIVNLLEFAFDLAPKTNARTVLTPVTGASGLPDVRRDVGGALVIEYIRRRASIFPGIATTAEFADTPAGPWITALDGTVTSVGATFERVVVTDPSTGPTRLARVRVRTTE